MVGYTKWPWGSEQNGKPSYKETSWGKACLATTSPPIPVSKGVIYHDDTMHVSFPRSITDTERWWAGCFAYSTAHASCKGGSRSTGGDGSNMRATTT
eukprot:5888962-Pyramimonas_sp.AAC.1